MRTLSVADGRVYITWPVNGEYLTAMTFKVWIINTLKANHWRIVSGGAIKASCTGLLWSSFFFGNNAMHWIHTINILKIRWKNVILLLRNIQTSRCFRSRANLTSLHLSTRFDPFSFKGQAGEQFHLSKIGYLNAFLQLSFFSYCFLAALIEQQSIVGYFFKSEISQMGDSLQKFIGMTGMSILFLCSSIRVRLLIHIWDRISYIDDRFLNLGVCFNYPAIMRLRLLQIFLINGVQLGYLISSNWMLLGNDVRPIYTAIVAFYVPQIFLLSIVMLFNATLHRLWQHFTVLNQVG